MFSQAVVENLGHYVYFLRDPRNHEVFYVGKGTGNRVFHHLAGTLETDEKSEKLDRLREIRDSGAKVEHYILRHGLTEASAFEVEAALIDFIGLDSLTNLMGGIYTADFGMKTGSEIIAQYEAAELVAEDPLVLLCLNRNTGESNMNLKAIVRIYARDIRPQAQAELDWFRRQPTLESAIEQAALATNSKGKRYSHQRRLKKTALEEARRVLLMNSKTIAQSKSFDDLFSLVETMVEPITGIGELYIYDTSLRIGAKLHYLPTKVYLHAGTRKGAWALGFEGRARALKVSEMPSELRQLEPQEIEDVLCIFKADLKAVGVKYTKDEVTKRSWCG